MLRLDTFADLACPWCYVAEARLDAVLAAEGLAAERFWHPFLLDPSAPEAGTPWAAFSVAKFGSEGRAAAMYRTVERAGREAGLAIDFSKATVAPSTRRAHRLVLAAEDAGRAEGDAGARGHAAAMRFFRAHFEEGQNLSDPDTLVRLAAEAGLDAAAARAVLASDAHEADVDDAVRAAARLGLSGVPLVVVNGRHALQGAQPEAAVRETLHAARAA